MLIFRSKVREKKGRGRSDVEGEFPKVISGDTDDDRFVLTQGTRRMISKFVNVFETY